MTDDVLNAYKRLLNEQISLMTKYHKLLSESEDDEHLKVMLKNYPLFFPHVLVERRCPLADKQPKDIANLMIDSSKPDAGHQHLNEFTQDASDLIIVDGYLLSNPSQKPTPAEIEENRAKVMEYLFCSIPNEALEHVHIVTREYGLDHDLFDEVKAKLSQQGTEMTHHFSNLIHDRIWIKNISDGKNRCSAKVVGTSLNSLGAKKASFILDLPQTDLEEILGFMDQHSLLGPLQHHIRHFA